VLDSLNGGSGAMGNVLTQLSALSPAQQSQELQRLTPTPNRSIQLSSRNILLNSFDLQSLRLDSLRNFSSASSGDDTLKNDLWFKPFGGGMNQTAQGGFSGYNGSNWGFAGGFDHRYNDDLAVGAAVTYAKTHLSQADQQSGNTSGIDTYQLSLYGTKNVDIGYLEAMVAYARQAYTGQRNTGITGTADSFFGGNSWSARIGGGIPYQIDSTTTVTPIIRLDWSHIDQNGYNEHGGGVMDLNVLSSSADRLRSSLGGQLIHNTDLFGVRTQPYLRVFWHYDFLNTGVTTTSSFAGGGSAFITPGQSLDHNTGTVGAGINVLSTDNLTATVGYDANLGSGYQSHTAQATVKWSF
jgi:outer membrane autotransporter protein